MAEKDISWLVSIPGFGGFLPCQVVHTLDKSLGFGSLGEVHGPRGLVHSSPVVCLQGMCTYGESQHPTGSQGRCLADTLAPREEGA